MCLNWKVAAGLAAVALAAWFLAPNLAALAIPLAGVALCLASKLFLLRRLHGRRCDARTGAADPLAVGRADEGSLPGLRARLASLRAEEARLAAEVARLEAAGQSAAPGGGAAVPAAPGRA
jgi:hypothetical protein